MRAALLSTLIVLAIVAGFVLGEIAAHLYSVRHSHQVKTPYRFDPGRPAGKRYFRLD